MYFQKGQILHRQGGWRGKCEINSPADTEVREEGGGSAAEVGAEIPLQTLEKTMVGHGKDGRSKEQQRGAVLD